MAATRKKMKPESQNAQLIKPNEQTYQRVEMNLHTNRINSNNPGIKYSTRNPKDSFCMEPESSLKMQVLVVVNSTETKLHNQKLKGQLWKFR